jgi:hypothetical protein
VPYQIAALDVIGLLDQFGFAAPVLVAEKHACLTVLVVAAWQPTRPAGLVLVDAVVEVPPGVADTGLAGLALRTCPPDWPTLRALVQCPMLELSAPAPDAQLAAFVKRCLN